MNGEARKEADTFKGFLSLFLYSLPLLSPSFFYFLSEIRLFISFTIKTLRFDRACAVDSHASSIFWGQNLVQRCLKYSNVSNNKIYC